MADAHTDDVGVTLALQTFTTWSDVRSPISEECAALFSVLFLLKVNSKRGDDPNLAANLVTIANPLKTKRIYFIEGLSPYRAVNTLHFGYKNQYLNVL
jgi:hypothetical protein